VTPRRTHPKRKRTPGADEEPAFSADLVIESPAGWHVRAVQPVRATKMYRCPGCNQEVRPGTAHVVAWREGDEEGRRHWHRPCWTRSVRMR
jgi:hypothetical protein